MTIASPGVRGWARDNSLASGMVGGDCGICGGIFVRIFRPLRYFSGHQFFVCIFLFQIFGLFFSFFFSIFANLIFFFFRSDVAAKHVNSKYPITSDSCFSFPLHSLYFQSKSLFKSNTISPVSIDPQEEKKWFTTVSVCNPRFDDTIFGVRQKWMSIEANRRETIHVTTDTRTWKQWHRIDFDHLLLYANAFAFDCLLFMLFVRCFSCFVVACIH